MNSAQLVPALVGPFIAWRIYQRLRRNIGRQLLRPKRLIGSIVMFSIVSAGIAFAAAQYLPSLAALGGGLGLGAIAAVFGLRLTRFETREGVDYYIPNTYIGVGLSLLLVGRIIFRVLVLTTQPPAGAMPPPSLFHSPLTLLVFGATAGYYVAYSAGVLRHHRKTTRIN